MRETKSEKNNQARNKKLALGRKLDFTPGSALHQAPKVLDPSMKPARQPDPGPNPQPGPDGGRKAILFLQRGRAYFLSHGDAAHTAE